MGLTGPLIVGSKHLDPVIASLSMAQGATQDGMTPNPVIASGSGFCRSEAPPRVLAVAIPTYDRVEDSPSKRGVE